MDMVLLSLYNTLTMGYILGSSVVVAAHCVLRQSLYKKKRFLSVVSMTGRYSVFLLNYFVLSMKNKYTIDTIPYSTKKERGYPIAR